MASIATDRNGRRRIQFFDTNGKHKTLRLGDVSKKAAEQVRGYVEDLARAIRVGTARAEATTAWV